MTICIATDGFPPQTGGIATFNGHLSALLQEAGHKVVVLYVDYANHGEDEVQTNGYFTKVLLRDSYHRYYADWQRYFRPGGFDAANWIAIGMSMRDWLLAHHRQFGIDVVEVSDYGGAGIFLCNKDLPPLVITGHGSLVQFTAYNYTAADAGTKVIQELELLSYRHAAAVLAHSTVSATDLQQRSKREITQVLPPWHWQDKAIPPSSTQGPIVCAGGLQPVKGVYTAATAMEKLLPQDASLQLTWIGGDTWLAPGYRRMSEWLAMQYPRCWQKNFVWQEAMPHEALLQQLAKASLVLIPAQFETFNYVAVEAAAMSKPIIMTSTTGAAQYFTHGHDAWIIPPDDADALVTAILQLSADEPLRKRLGGNAAANVKGVFNPADIVSSRIAAYTLAMQSAPASPEGMQPWPAFLRRYRTRVRKWYYCIRRQLKKLFKRQA